MKLEDKAIWTFVIIQPIVAWLILSFMPITNRPPGFYPTAPFRYYMMALICSRGGLLFGQLIFYLISLAMFKLAMSARQNGFLTFLANLCLAGALILPIYLLLHRAVPFCLNDAIGAAGR